MGYQAPDLLDMMIGIYFRVYMKVTVRPAE